VINSKLSAYFKSEFLRNLLTLLTGSVLAQVISLIIVPILTRTYSPNDFGMLALYLSLASILAVICTARYEVAIVLPEDDTVAINLIGLSVLISVLIGLCLLVFLLLLDEWFARFLGNPDIRPWLYLIPFSTILSGCYQPLCYWTTRKKEFKRLAVSKLTETGTAGTVQLSVGMAGPLSGGLIVGNFMGKFLVTLTMGLLTFRTHGALLSTLSLKGISRSANTYKDFPLYSTGGTLLVTLASQMPILFITKYFGTTITGFYSLSFRILILPLTFFSSALSQVLFQKIVEIHQNRPEQLQRQLARIFLLLLLLISPMVAIMWFAGEELFVFAFGDAWRTSGELAKYLSLSVALQFAVSPLGSALALEKTVKIGTSWQALYFVTTLTVLLIFKDNELKQLVIALVVHDIVLYLIYLAAILKFSGHKLEVTTPAQHNS